MKDWKNLYAVLGRSTKKYDFYFGRYGYRDLLRGEIAGKLPKTHLDWAKRAVKIRANKTYFDCFENDTLGLNDLMVEYGVKEALNKIKADIAICGCGFLALVDDRVMPFTAEEATGVFSWRQQNLEKGLAVFRGSSTRSGLCEPPDNFIVYDKDRTTIHIKGQDDQTLQNRCGRPLIGLLTYNATAKRPFGQSVISRAARDAIIDGSRATRQAMVSAHFYNRKVDLVLGVDEDTDINKVESQVGDILRISPNSNGQIPQIAQFAQHAMAPFTDTIMTAARNFCTATELTLANLAITTDAPQSTEALEIVSDDLKDDISDWQHELGEELKYFLVTLYLYRNNISEIDDNLAMKIRSIKPIWMPIYEADVSKFGDGLAKIAQNAPNIVGVRSVWRKLGLTSDEIDRLINQNSAAPLS